MKRFSLDNTVDEGFSTLVYGLPSVGKTRFAGDALQHALATKGDSHGVLYVNAGEDGFASLGGLRLGNAGVTVESLADLDAIVKEGKKYHTVVFDALQGVSRFAMHAVCGKVRLPKTGNNEVNEWSLIHRKLEAIVGELRRLARYTIFIALAHPKENATTGETWVLPKLDGRQATDAIAWFDFVGYLDAETQPNGTITRSFVLRPFPPGTKQKPNIATRQRLLRYITDDIVVPDGGGGWRNFLDAIAAASRPVDGRDAAAKPRS